jgi:hypothetical protein
MGLFSIFLHTDPAFAQMGFGAAGLLGHGRTAGASIGMPRARDIR